MGTIAIGVWNGVEELDLAGPYEVLAAWASAERRRSRVVTVAKRPTRSGARTGCGSCPTTWDEVGEVEVVVLPGAGTRPLLQDEPFLERLRVLAAGGTLMTSVCTGALVLAASGLLEGRPATTHWSALERLAAFDGVEVDPMHAMSTAARSSPRPACRPASTWRCISSHGSTPSSARARYAVTSSTTPSLPSDTRRRHVTR